MFGLFCKRRVRGFENGGDSQIRVEGCVRLGYRFRSAGLGSLGVMALQVGEFGVARCDMAR